MATASSIVSTVLRVVCYLFLRVAPHHSAIWFIPPLYSAYLYLHLSAKHQPLSTKDANDEKKSAPAEPEPWRVIALSLPSSVPRLNKLNVAINTLLLLMSVDFVFTPYFDAAKDVAFTRVGAVYPDSVKIVARYPADNATEHSIRLLYREVPTASESWRDGPRVSLSQENDWVATAKLSGLWPKTTYEYTLAYPNRTLLPYPVNPIQFHTFPDPRLPGSHFRFVFTSCLIPNFPYVPGYSRTIQGFDYLAKYLSPKTNTRLNVHTPAPAEESPIESEAVSRNFSESKLQAKRPAKAANPSVEFLLMLGDFIYADVPFYFGDDVEAYRRLYRRNYQSPSFRKVYEQLPIFHTYDDHEIKNDYAGLNNDSKPPFPSASNAFRLYSADANYDSPSKGHHYYDFRYGDAAFFVMDTRRHRSDFRDSETPQTMLGDAQLGALHDWLAKVNQTTSFKFIVSSVPFTDLWGVQAKEDCWPAFPSEKADLLEAFHSVPNVVVLSGDRHEFANIEYSSSIDYQHTVREISTSPLNMFYVPFVRTLYKKTKEVVQISRKEVKDTPDGPEVVIMQETVPKERVIKAVATGTSKWSTIEIDTRDLEKPTLRLELMVNGRPKYHYELVGTPVELHYSSTALGAFVAGGMKDVFNKIGFKPTKWF